MPSPFPGMDPYLEHANIWPGVHHGLISEIQAELNRRLRPRYRAVVEERVYVSDDDDIGREFVVPDVHLIRRGNASLVHRLASENRTALIEPVEITTLIYDEIHEARIEIVDPIDHAIVTVIEILSITNKLSGSNGRRSYLQKRHEIMNSTSHLVEIDLLRSGARMLIRERLNPHEYLVHVARHDSPDGRRSTVWPIPIELPLPEIPIPLKSGDADAIIDLQKILTAAYERDGSDMAIDYARPPVPPLTPEQNEWAKQLIAASKTA